MRHGLDGGALPQDPPGGPVNTKQHEFVFDLWPGRRSTAAQSASGRSVPQAEVHRRAVRLQAAVLPGAAAFRRRPGPASFLAVGGSSRDGGGEEHLIAPDVGRGESTARNGGTPFDILGVAPLQRRVAGGDTVVIGTAPLWPVGGRGCPQDASETSNR